MIYEELTYTTEMKPVLEKAATLTVQKYRNSLRDVIKIEDEDDLVVLKVNTKDYALSTYAVFFQTLGEITRVVGHNLENIDQLDQIKF